MESLPAQMIQTEVIPKDSHLSPGVINFALLFAAPTAVDGNQR